MRQKSERKIKNILNNGSFFLALLGMVEILWRDWRGGHEK